MRIYQLGYAGNMGGANTECWHTVRLWRLAGWKVHMVPTWGSDPHWEDRFNSIGVITHHVEPGEGSDQGICPDCNKHIPQLDKVPGLAGSVIVGMCNQHFCHCAPRLRELGCKLIWVNCMCFMFGHERRAWIQAGPADAYMFQSEYQRERLEMLLRPHHYQPEQGFHIRGAFFPDEYDFNPRHHELGGEFCVGRLSRPELDKWSSDHWKITGRIPYSGRRALCMGWTPEVCGKVGKPPEWATCYAPQVIPVEEFLGQCHCLLGLNGGAAENWPRVGLEAMAAGVPLVVQNAWGWREMIKHDETGYLCDNGEELAYWPAYLARNEARRLEIAEAARAHLETLCSPSVLIEGWRKMLEYVLNRKPSGVTV